ncbi:hypothetical protein SAMN05421770_1095 [Granulicella rosea]|uniref:Uncharacterized protein n=1 Tax=Granulicella rosea TaxID=474952 RepID=A0A239M0J5_9BACT|nr:hypothetical protein SAMN05421770_1095 [Granulicella rosea]
MTGRKKGGSHLGALFVAGGGILFVAYIFNYQGVQTTLDGFFNDLYRGSQTHTGEVQTGFDAVLPIVGYVLAGVIGLVVLRTLFRGAGSLSQSLRLSRRQEVSLHDFCADAQKHDISIKVAREAYKLMEPLCRGRMRAGLTDRLGGDLRLSELQRDDLYDTLLLMTDRKADPAKARPAMETLLEMMTVVQDSPRRSVGQSVIRPVAAASPVVHPVRLSEKEKQLR